MLEVRIRYLINDVWIDPALMGWNRRIKRGDESVEIRFPDSSANFTARDWETDLHPTPSAYAVTSVCDEPDWDSRTVAVRLVNVVVAFEADLPIDRPENPFDGEYGSSLQQIYERGRSRAEATIQAFIEWLRGLSHQPWLGLVADSPKQYGRGGVYYAHSGESIAGMGPTRSRTFTSSRVRIDSSQLDDVMTGVESGQAVPPSQALLADSWHLSNGTDQPDHTRAIILAAIACEVRVQEHLRAAANEHSAEMLHLLRSKGSTLHYFLNDVMRVVCGTTLQKSDPGLWNHVQALASNRNSLVHEGILNPKKSLQLRAPEIAQKIFDWLESHAH